MNQSCFEVGLGRGCVMIFLTLGSLQEPHSLTPEKALGHEDWRL